jgi:RimJ/RimL family protein N-acetyltransferase
VRATLYYDDRSVKASLRIWDALGFTRAGLIPRAGRLRRADGNGEEWVDSVIYYRSFVDEEEWARPIDR